MEYVRKMHLLTTPLLIASLIVLAPSPAWGYFLLNLPKSLGYKMEDATIAPCGGFNFNGVHFGTNYSVKGFPFAATSTHSDVTYTVQVRLRKQPDVAHTILPPLYVSMYGSLCIPSVPVNPDWLGELAEYHVIQDHATARTYQCALVQFVEKEVNSTNLVECKNSTGVVGAFQPWGSNVTTTPTPTPSPTSTAPGNQTGGAAPTFGGWNADSGSSAWLAIGLSAAVSAVLFSSLV